MVIEEMVAMVEEVVLLMEAMGEVVMLVSAFLEHFCARYDARHSTYTISFNHYSSPMRVGVFCVCHFIFILFKYNWYTTLLVL